MCVMWNRGGAVIVSLRLLWLYAAKYSLYHFCQIAVSLGTLGLIYICELNKK